ncbi:hypothetical protein [Caloramator sp. Dgby_cultured_2]|uniref:hypothetical protein n=1 Tax=Caloramator sp. Dgby_cultured_2 TaxID=3029174 RepID=UPI00237D3D2C|nr:hypothetical protein [Caloramator sp. Dgby_cultured_2]WDU84238.1 hypothetical protein PWK10_07950 [Caloramator sp. Dgby_cultured_2]
MKIIRSFSGFCPTLNKDNTINVEYLDARSFDNDNLFIKGLAECEYHSNFNCPIANDCPILKTVPEKLNL